MEKMNKRIVIAFFTTALFLIILACGSSEEQAKEEVTPEVLVNLIPREEIRVDRRILGLLEPVETESLFAPYKGQVIKLLIPEGRYVNKGERLAVFQRYQPGQVFQALEILAPMSGYLAAGSWESGELISADTELFLIYKPGVFDVILHLPNDFVEARDHLRPNRVLLGDQHANDVGEARLISVSPKVDRSSYTRLARFRIRQGFSQETAPRPGEFVSVEFNIYKKSNYVVEGRNLRNEGPAKKVEAISPDGIFKTHLFSNHRYLQERAAVGLEAVEFQEDFLPLMISSTEKNLSNGQRVLVRTNRRVK